MTKRETARDKLALLHERRDEAERQRPMPNGRGSARQRLELLLDADSFVEIDRFVTAGGVAGTWGDGVVTGHGCVHGRIVYVFAQEAAVYGGTLSEAHAGKICKIMDLAMANGAPIVGLNDSGGARIQEGVRSMAGYGEVFYRNTLASGVVPQISAVLGSCAGGAVYSPALTDFVFMVDGSSHMFLTGPDVVRAVLGEEVDKDSLGGAKVHGETTGIAHFTSPSEPTCLAAIRRLLAYLPSNNVDSAPPGRSSDPRDRQDESLCDIVPDAANAPYDMRQVLRSVVDDGQWLEVQASFARNLLCGFAHLGGRSVGLVANQPEVLAGVLDGDASIKAASFVRFCDAFSLPIVTFVDCPGFLPGRAQEHAGIIKHGAKLLFAYCEATVPKVTVITRKAYGGAYCVMGSKQVRGDINLAWPTAEVAVMGARGAVEILHRQEIAAATDRAALVDARMAEYHETFANPYAAARLGYVDDIIDPRETRQKVIGALDLLANKRVQGPVRKHGCIRL